MVDLRAETASSSDKTEFTETEDQCRTHQDGLIVGSTRKSQIPYLASFLVHPKPVIHNIFRYVSPSFSKLVHQYGYIDKWE
jgi:hypothetical protein